MSFEPSTLVFDDRWRRGVDREAQEAALECKHRQDERRAEELGEARHVRHRHVPQQCDRPIWEGRAGRARFLVADAVRVEPGEYPVDRGSGDVEHVRADLRSDLVADREAADQQDEDGGLLDRSMRRDDERPDRGRDEQDEERPRPRRRDEQRHRDDQREPGRITHDADRGASATWSPDGREAALARGVP